MTHRPPSRNIITDGLAPARKQHRTGWLLASGAILLLVGLALWMKQLNRANPETTAEGPAPIQRPLVADGENQPGQPVAVPFGQEHCIPWHISAVEKPAPPTSRFVLITSRVADPFGLLLAGFSRDCGNRLQVLTVEDLRPGDLSRAVRQQDPTAIVLTGPQGLPWVRSEAAGVPLLFAGIRDPHALDWPAVTTAGVLPWVPVIPLVRHALITLPRSLDTVAVIYPDGPWKDMAEEAVDAIRKAGRKAFLVPIQGDGDLTGPLAKAASQGKAWLVLADRQKIDDGVFNRIQVAAEQARIPLAVPDEEHVRAGAYVGVGPSSERIGQQVCRLAGALVRGSLPEGERVFCPEYTFAAVHSAVVEKLGYVLDPENLRQAKIYKWH